VSVIFDATHFAHMTGGDRPLQLEVIGMFRAQVSSWAAVLSPDTETGACRAAVHTLKGSARGIGLWALAETCESTETAFDAEGAEIGAALADLHAALAVALTALDAFEHE